MFLKDPAAAQQSTARARNGYRGRQPTSEKGITEYSGVILISSPPSRR